MQVCYRFSRDEMGLESNKTGLESDETGFESNKMMELEA